MEKLAAQFTAWILDFGPQQTKPSSHFKFFLSSYYVCELKSFTAFNAFQYVRLQGCLVCRLRSSKAAFFVSVIRINVSGLLNEVSLPSWRSSIMLFVFFPFLQLKKSKSSGPTDAPLSHTKHCSWNASSAVPSRDAVTLWHHATSPRHTFDPFRCRVKAWQQTTNKQLFGFF